MDDPMNHEQHDSPQIEIDEECEVRHWCEKFNIIENELREAFKVGNLANALRKYVGPPPDIAKPR